MSSYKHILLAADFTEHGNEVANKAKQLAEDNQAQLSIIHVFDNLPIIDATYGPTIPFNEELSADLKDAAQKRITEMANKLNIPENKQWLEIGSPKLEIVRVAQENDVDLIVIGSHGRHGFALLLGSTANSVLHHATCDVLAVRLQDD